ncbi:MAG: hypothetical protein IPH05_12165 [Flavobacteriales bacterium]|jgi:hypothetical protein|nr:hypothetical protein [Flavobacteriales bacterium]MBK6551145.1 hypothetical protein [Flavobacteriales bacterium]MBK6883676.1 hypothetical protein [Flavobacteriales bacterium]MBK7101067.1 hypothetical protein [Flavobacteriales bacterium]MBK7111783.1 hypothetical protein [Flavobacteriales bacterium]
MPALTATEIAWSMRCHAQALHHEWITPNAYLYAWESDLITVSALGHVHEIEIKTSRSDLKNDMKKPKHGDGLLVKGTALETEGATKPKDKRPIRRPNFFSFALPCAIYRARRPVVLPPYAGVYTVDEYGRVREERAPVQLHTERISTRQLFLLARRIHHRYWDQLRRGQHAPDTLQLELAG